jgi:hypothetical protein
MMLVSRLLAMVGNETVKIRLAVPAIKLPSAALISSNQLIRESMSREDGTQKMRVACFVFVLVFDCPINFIVADHRFNTGYCDCPGVQPITFTNTITVLLSPMSLNQLQAKFQCRFHFQRRHICALMIN